MSRKEKIKKYIKNIRFWKTLTWRLISWVASVGIALLLTGNVALALSFGLADTLLKTSMYWIHEWKWDKVTNKKIKKLKTVEPSTEKV